MVPCKSVSYWREAVLEGNLQDAYIQSRFYEPLFTLSLDAFTITIFYQPGKKKPLFFFTACRNDSIRKLVLEGACVKAMACLSGWGGQAGHGNVLHRMCTAKTILQIVLLCYVSRSCPIEQISRQSDSQQAVS